MNKHWFYYSAAPLALATAGAAHAAPAASATSSTIAVTTAAAAAQAPAARHYKAAKADTEVFSTGVAKGRDRLDSATSTSSLRSTEIEKLGARSLGEVFRNIPGIRAESVSGEGNASYSIRGLPLASNGSKFLQFQDDGLPVLEFGDLAYTSPDLFMRADFNLAQIETIRGGSASTFASNSPGGVINLISRTGETEGGNVQVTTGLGYDEKRLDFDYGGKLSDTLRFHFGGFYRQSEGPRAVGYDAYKGGQFKFNLTKQFTGGYVRVYAKLLDDRSPAYMQAPVRVTGTNADPHYESVANFDITRDTLLSRNITNVVGLDGNNNLARNDIREGMHAKTKAIGLESQFDIGKWTVTERFRYAANSGRVIQNFPLAVAPASALAFALGGPGARLSYATGPNAGQAITDPASLNGNGLLATSLLMNYDIHSVDTMTNDLRLTREWALGAGKLTTTAGFYKSAQAFNVDWLFSSIVSDVRGGGDAALVNVTTATGVPQTQDGFFAYSAAIVSPGYRRKYDVNYDVNAPYASVNYHVGRVAVGASVRYDYGSAEGSLFGYELGGNRVTVAPYDINGNGSISPAESRTGVLPLTLPAPVDYDYHYLSYSAGINYRVAKSLAVFARYSRGGRASADRILFTPAVSAIDGSLPDKLDGHDVVKQTELGVKYRKSDITLNLTGFSATTGERNLQINSRPDGTVQVERIIRSYDARGVELEGGIRRGPFALTVGATYTDAKIASDEFHPEIVGNKPRHQAKLIFQATPQVVGDRFAVGANIVGTTSSYAQDSNQLKLPAYTTVGAFVQVRPTDQVMLSVNANNLFDTLGLAEVTQASIPPSGIVTARAINGRTISTSLRFSF